MRGWPGRLFGGSARQAPRLGGEEAERIARAAAVGLPMADRLVAGGVERVGGRLVWRFHTGTRGSWLAVEVDDATGEATVHEMRGR